MCTGLDHLLNDFLNHLTFSALLVHRTTVEMLRSRLCTKVEQPLRQAGFPMPTTILECRGKLVWPIPAIPRGLELSQF